MHVQWWGHGLVGQSGQVLRIHKAHGSVLRYYPVEERDEDQPATTHTRYLIRIDSISTTLGCK